MNRQFRTELYEILSFLKVFKAYKTSSLHFIFLLQREGAAPVTVVDRAMSPNVPDKMSPVKSTRFRDDILLLFIRIIFFRTLLVPSSPNVCPENGFLETNF